MIKKISIITPTYNHEQFLEQCIKSVLNQTYDNWELIIIDDYSSDKTREIIKKYAKRDKRIIPIYHKKNWGIKKLADTYNEGLKRAKGNYVCILEGDDFWPQDKLEVQIKNARCYKALSLSFGDWVLTDVSGNGLLLKVYSEFETTSSRFILGKERIIKLFRTLRFDIDSATVMMSKKKLKQIGGFQQGGSVYPFVDLPTYFALATVGDFLYIPHILGYYRRHTHSSWLKFALGSETMGRFEISLLFNKKKKTTEKNKKYLKYRQNIKQLSKYFNSAAGEPKKNIYYFLTNMLMRVFFFIQLIKYRLSHLIQ